MNRWSMQKQTRILALAAAFERAIGFELAPAVRA